MAATVNCRCEYCKAEFVARVADRKRGWARFCSKSCKASRQAKRTGYSGPQFAYVASDDDWCHPFEEDAFRA